MIPSGVLDLLAAGDAFDDLIFHGLTRLPKPGEEIRTANFVRTIGGGAVITAVAGARLGLRCGVISALGSNAARMLRAEGVSVRNLLQKHEMPALTVALSTRRDRSFVTFEGANARLPRRLLAAVSRIRARHVHFAFVPRPIRPWIRVVDSLRQRGATTSWDFGWHSDLAGDREFARLAESVDYLFLNRAEAVVYARSRTISSAYNRWQRSRRSVVVKLGASGSVLLSGNRRIRERSFRVHPVDTTGAGDAFNAGFIAGRLRGSDGRAALRLANRVGALSTRQPGGLAALPYMSELS